MERVVVLFRKAPYGSAAVGEGLRWGTGVSGMGIDAKIVLIEDGVFAVLKGQDPSDLNMHPYDQAMVKAFSDEDAGAELFVVKESLEERGISPDDIVLGKVITMADLAQMIEDKDTGLISF